MPNRPFQSDLVLEEKIGEATLRAYNVGFDQNKFRLQPLVDVIAEVIPEFALGYHGGVLIPLNELRRRLKDASLRVFTTDDYKNRGEFGELILHLLLRDYCGTIPLISKIVFKDTDNSAVHGFDGVHVTVTNESKKLWLGESKLYTDGKAGVRALASDLKEHLKGDYLRREFSLISTKLPETVPEIEHWRALLHEHQKLEAALDNLCIPMVCTYSSSLYGAHNDNTEEYIQDFISECRILQEMFEEKKIKTNVDVILMLLPVPSKDELVAKLHERLKHMQAI
jgi:HamA